MYYFFSSVLVAAAHSAWASFFRKCTTWLLLPHTAVTAITMLVIHEDHFLALPSHILSGLLPYYSRLWKQFLKVLSILFPFVHVSIIWMWFLWCFPLLSHVRFYLYLWHESEISYNVCCNWGTYFSIVYISRYIYLVYSLALIFELFLVTAKTCSCILGSGSWKGGSGSGLPLSCS